MAVKDIRIDKLYAPWSWDEAHGCNEVQVPSGTVGSPAVQHCSCTCAEISDACHEISFLKKWGLQYGLLHLHSTPPIPGHLDGMEGNGSFR